MAVSIYCQKVNVSNCFQLWYVCSMSYSETYNNCFAKTDPVVFEIFNLKNTHFFTNLVIAPA